MRTLQSQMVEKGLSQARIQEIDKENTKTSMKPKEKLSQRELKELMGYHRGTYSRSKGGSIRQR